MIRRALRRLLPAPPRPAGLWTAIGFPSPPALEYMTEYQRDALRILLNKEARRVLSLCMPLRAAWVCGLTLEERAALSASSESMDNSERVQAAMAAGQADFVVEQELA